MRANLTGVTIGLRNEERAAWLQMVGEVNAPPDTVIQILKNRSGVEARLLAIPEQF